MTALEELNELKRKFRTGEIKEAEYYSKAPKLVEKVRASIES